MPLQTRSRTRADFYAEHGQTQPPDKPEAVTAQTALDAERRLHDGPSPMPCSPDRT